ncbi:MAG: hypothetical protein M9925_13690 [Chloroflexi bacterium]|nr:hypothetical protein [Chloroflexota bacterium]
MSIELPPATLGTLDELVSHHGCRVPSLQNAGSADIAQAKSGRWPEISSCWLPKHRAVKFAALALAVHLDGGLIQDVDPVVPRFQQSSTLKFGHNSTCGLQRYT